MGVNENGTVPVVRLQMPLVCHFHHEIHQSDRYHWHLEIMPKLTKEAGFEWGSGFYINPTAPEEAARYLREITVTTLRQ